MSARPVSFLSAVLCGCLLAACASNVERPTESLTRAQTLIDQAEQAGAQQFAAAELDQARDKVRRAEAASSEGNQRAAQRLASEAVVDAELAAAMAASGAARQAAEETRRSVETLEQEANRPPVAQ